jgi:hypothetical protein
VVGRGTVRDGDETQGLAAVLLSLGVRTVFAAVSRIPDELAAGAMTAYHRLLVTGIDSATALAQATADLPTVARAFTCFGPTGARDLSCPHAPPRPAPPAPPIRGNPPSSGDGRIPRIGWVATAGQIQIAGLWSSISSGVRPATARAHLRRHADGDIARRDVLDDHRVGADLGVVAGEDRTEDLRAGPDRDPVAQGGVARSSTATGHRA